MQYPEKNLTSADSSESAGAAMDKPQAAADRAGAATPPPPAEKQAPPFTSGVMLAEKYRLTKELGRGGMGAVWAAHNTVLDADVAIKVLRSDMAGTNLHDRLLREARAVAKLGHPNIVRVFDVGHASDGSPFLVMELLRGHDLQKAINTHKKLEAITAVSYLLPIANALACAHEAGFVHRDLKPENIFLAEQTGGPVRPILLDFGIALSWSEHSHRLTQEGTAVGSPTYMSPEQSRGDEATHRSDIWSFSVVLYEAVTGQVPFSNTNLPRLQRDIIHKPALDFAHHGLVEDSLWAIVERGLAKNPVKRWRTMRLMGVELARWLLKQGVEADATNTSLRATWLEADRHKRASVSMRSASDGIPSLASPSSEDITHPFGRFRRLRRALVAGAILIGLGTGITLWSSRGSGRRAAPGESPAPAVSPKHLPGAGTSPALSTAVHTAVSIEPSPPGGGAPGARQTGGQEPPPAKALPPAADKVRQHPKAVPGKPRAKLPPPRSASPKADGTGTSPATRPLDIKTEF
jgi:serine/threonine protein kinase